MNDQRMMKIATMAFLATGFSLPANSEPGEPEPSGVVCRYHNDIFAIRATHAYCVAKFLADNPGYPNTGVQGIGGHGPSSAVVQGGQNLDLTSTNGQLVYATTYLTQTDHSVEDCVTSEPWN